jgi:hypothetical protein
MTKGREALSITLGVLRGRWRSSGLYGRAALPFVIPRDLRFFIHRPIPTESAALRFVIPTGA